jgi:endonuclease-3
MAVTQQTARKILGTLDTLYPDVETQLKHGNPFELLIATLLSAQCTDRQVNETTPALFARYPSPRALADAPLEEIERLIRKTGFFHIKARRVKDCARALLESHGGEVPRNLEALAALPGVGRKTANVVLGAVWDIPGIVVDTHVKRIAKRLGFTVYADPVKVEKDLMAALPKEAWNRFSLQLIYLGRSVCAARKPKCPECAMNMLCAFSTEEKAAAAAGRKAG